MIIRHLAWLITFVWLLAFPAAAQDTTTPETPAAPSREPAEIVTELQEGLLAAMRAGDQVDFDGRYARLEPVIEGTHDIGFVARSVMRKHWGSLDENQRRNFYETFRELCIGTYADKFDSYAGQRFERGEQRTLKRGSILIRTKMIRPDDDPVQFDYVLSKRKNGWRIVNVVADGVSDLALKRTEYTSVMEDEGFDGLLTRLQAKIVAFGSTG